MAGSHPLGEAADHSNFKRLTRWGVTKILKHDGYIALVSYDEGDELMHGSVVSARAVLHFAGRDIDELKAAFADTIPTTGNGARSVTSSRRVGKTRYAPFRASDHLDSEDAQPRRLRDSSRVPTFRWTG